MIDDLKPYPEYKPSSQAWLGDVPQHWSVVPNRALFSEVKDRNHPDEEMLSVTITRGIVRQKALLEGSSKKDSSNLDKSAYKLLQPRDIAYNKMRAWQGAIGASALRGIISPAYVVMRLRNDDDLPIYFHHLYRTPQFAKEAERWSYGITSDMWSLRPEHFKMIYTPEPPSAEQAAIVRFLDWVNRRLERAIRSKRKVIALLTEQKQAIIHRAVTRGFDPSVPLKPSGIPWLGDIPKHWGVSRMRRIVQPGRRLTYGVLKPGEYDTGGRLMVRAQDFSFGWTSPEKMFRVSKSVEEPYIRCRLAPGDLLYTLVGAGTGNVGVAPDWLDGANISRANARVAIDPSKAVPEFAALVLRSPVGKEQVAFYSKGSAQPVLNLEYVGAFAFPIPPRTEQVEIVERVRSDTNGQDLVIARTEREIELLREYRTRLVADVVTGKFDVREAAARLPEEDESNTADESVELGDEIEPADEETAA